jgi:cytochrome c553
MDRLMKLFALGFLTALALILIGACLYLEFGFADMRSDENPPSWERGLMYSAVHASVRRSAPKMQSPFPATDERLIASAKLYLNDCVGCHGAPGKSPSEFGGTFYPRAPQFPQIGTQYSEAEVFWVAKHGIRMTGMYPQGPYYSDDQLWSLAAFITRANNLPSAVLHGIEPQGSR